MSLRIGSLCSGYGGLDLAVLDALGGTVAWHAQYDPDDKHQYAARILEHRFPGVPNRDDITAIDWAAVEPVDVLTAGFPCQPVSYAGLGKVTDDARWIWPAVAGAVRVLRPRLVVLENVAALVVRGLSDVLADLAQVGYVGSWRCLRASDVGAPHRRERCFIVAWPAADAADLGHERRRRTRGPDAALGGGAAAADAYGSALGPERHGEPAEQKGDDRRHRVDSSGRFVGWGPYAQAVTRWERILGRPAPAPVDVRGRLAPRFVEWMMGLPAGWVTDVPGIPTNAQLKALGNGVIPQHGAAAFRLLAERMAAGQIPADGPAKAPAFEVPPLFEEIPVPQPPGVPLGAPASWPRVVIDRAGSQCECTGGCGATHSRTAGRCPRRHGGWANRREVRPILAPRKPLTPLTKAVALPDAELMATCEECLKGAEKLARPPAA